MRRGIPVSTPEPEPWTIWDFIAAGFALAIVAIAAVYVGVGAILHMLTRYAQ